MTGRHPVRVDITDWIPGARRSQENGAIFQHVQDREHVVRSGQPEGQFDPPGGGTQLVSSGLIRIAGGREVHLRTVQGLGLELANSIFVGDYLTTEGQAANADLELLATDSFEVEWIAGD